MQDSVIETQSKTPVEIVQELLAIHATRKEAIEKFQIKQLDAYAGSKLSTIAQQSDAFISELMNELSNYGDGVGAGADRENEYQVTWKEVLKKLDTINAQECEQIFKTMEDTLKKVYAGITETKTELPVSLQEILARQAEKLEA